MAIFFPSIEKISKKYSLSESERKLLNKLYNQFKKNNSIEIHVQTMFFNKMINIAILTKNGAFFITDLELQENEKFYIKNLINLQQETSNEKLNFDFIKFSNLKNAPEIIMFELDAYLTNNSDLNSNKKNYLNQSFCEIKNMLFARYNHAESDFLIKFDKKQMELITKNENFKVKGTAGSGKTSIIVEKAVYEYRNSKKNNLIIVFNITARNFIRQKIYNNYKNLDRTYFKIVHFHGLPKEIRKFEKFDNIFIDEAQDFRKEWYDEIKINYLKTNGNIFIFGDEKQNIYTRELESKNIYTPIKGAWNILKISYRMDNKPSLLAINFQKEFYQNKYELEEIEIAKKSSKKGNMNLIFNEENYGIEGEVKYKYFQNRENFEESAVLDYVKDLMKSRNLSPNKTAILAMEIDLIHYLMEALSEKIDLSTITIETSEEKKEIKDGKKLERIRRNRKLNFQTSGETIVFSTIHSFKGLERENIILILSKINKKISDESKDELVYTGITRSKKNLYILNIGLEKYNEFFFSNSIEKGFEI